MKFVFPDKLPSPMRHFRMSGEGTKKSVRAEETGRARTPARGGARRCSSGHLGRALEEDETQRAAQGLDLHPHWELGLVPGKGRTAHMLLGRDLTSEIQSAEREAACRCRKGKEAWGLRDRKLPCLPAGSLGRVHTQFVDILFGECRCPQSPLLPGPACHTPSPAWSFSLLSAATPPAFPSKCPLLGLC